MDWSDPLPVALLRQRLRERAEALFLDLWGEPRNPRAARWRPRRRKPGDDPRRMAMQGPERGLWYDSARGLGGDPMDLIAVERLGLPDAKSDFPRVLTEAAQWLGAVSPKPMRRGAVKTADASDVSTDLRAVLSVATPLTGRALRYWIHTRGLDPPPEATILRLPGGALAQRSKGSRLPFAEREAVLALGRDVRGEVRALQRILLARDGLQRDPALPKFALGPIGRYPPFFPSVRRDAACGVLVLAEGPETAGAIWSAAGCRVLVCGGGLAGRVRRLSYLSTVIVAIEADAPDNPALRALYRAVAEARVRGARIGLLQCGGAPGSGFDAADLIRLDGGRQALRTQVARLAVRLRPP